MFTNTPSDRVQLVGLGELLSPACCMICRNGNCTEGYARLGVFYDYEGEQYLCRLCVIQIAELFGCLTPEEAEHLRDAANEYATLNNDLFLENQVLNERLRVFNDALAGISPDLPGIFSRSASNSSDEGKQDSNDVDGESLKDSNGEQPESTEPVKESGSSDVSESELSDVTGAEGPLL